MPLVVGLVPFLDNKLKSFSCLHILNLAICKITSWINHYLHFIQGTFNILLTQNLHFPLVTNFPFLTFGKFISKVYKCFRKLVFLLDLFALEEGRHCSQSSLEEILMMDILLFKVYVHHWINKWNKSKSLIHFKCST